MMIFKSLFFLLVGLSWMIPPPLQAQPDTLTYFPNDRVQGGAPTFYDTMNYLLAYPSYQYRNPVGTSVVAITITPTGEVKPTEMITSLGYSFDKIIRHAVASTKDIWLADPYVKNDIVIIVPFTFLFKNSVYYRSDEPPNTVQREVMVVGHHSNIRDDITLTTRANHHYVEKRYKKAKRYLDELIRRNPYNKNLYRMRATARYHTRDQEGSCSDLKRITTLLGEPMPDEASSWCP